MAELAVRDADRWWLGLTEKRRVQLHKMLDREAREQPMPEEQMALDVAGRASSGH